MERYDIVVIGGGPAGFAATMRAIDHGAKVALIEKSRLGGAGVFDGALSSKTLWELARDIRKLNYLNRGYRVKEYTLDYQEIIAVMQNAVNHRSHQMHYQLTKYEKEICPGMVSLKEGFGKILSKNEVEITDSDGMKEVIWGDNIVLATGSRPRKLPDIQIDEDIIVTSDGISKFKKFPESIVILGAGVIGCEFATIFSNFGQTKVSIIDKADRILPFEDDDVTDIIARNMEQNGVTIHRNSSLASMTIENGRVRYELMYHDGRREIHFAEKALVSVGRANNIEGLGLEEVGIQLNPRGSCIVDDCRTNVPNIYAVGDLTADICLVNVGELEARHAIERICSKVPVPTMHYDNVSTIMFLHPEVAGVGLNEKEAQKAGIAYRVAKYGYEYIPRALAMRNTDGFIKILVTDDDEMRVLGMRVVGSQASACVEAAAMLISMKMSVHELAELIHPHPSITEGIQECARMLMGRSIIKPEVFKSNIKHHRVKDGVCTELAVY